MIKKIDATNAYVYVNVLKMVEKVTCIKHI